MRKLVTVFLYLLPLGSSSQNCIPDVNNLDKISKQYNKAWETVLYESSLASSAINTSDWYLKIQYGRYNNVNVMSLSIIKYEESTQNATFESQLKGEKGKDYFIAFTIGEPIKVTVGGASTTSKMNNIMGKLVTTITLSSALTDALVKDLKSHFDNGLPTAFSITLAGDLVFEKEVKEKKAKNAKEKFYCFYDYNEKNKVEPPVEKDLNNLPPNLNVPKTLPRDSITNKISFQEIISAPKIDKEQLYNRARLWMVNYYKNEQFLINNKEVGRITKEGIFTKHYNGANGKTESVKHNYTISIFVKDGKYKYEITDFTGMEGIESVALEKVFISIQDYPKYTQYVNQQIYEGVEDIIKSLKSAMLTDPKSSDEW